MVKCPNCGSVNTYIHDKGWQHLLRRITLNSRLVCKDCRTTWKRRTPDRFSKLKKKSRRQKSNSTVTYRLKNCREVLELTTSESLENLVSQWQGQGATFISLNMTEKEELTTQELGVLLDTYRRFRAIGGDLIIHNASFQINDYLWSLNLGYLIATDQKIID